MTTKILYLKEECVLLKILYLKEECVLLKILYLKEECVLFQSIIVLIILFISSIKKPEN